MKMPTSERVANAERYKIVNGAWPANVPPLTGEEALRAIKVLWRVGSGRPFKNFRKLKLTSGRRETHFYREGWIINPNRGWQDLVHSISHRIDGTHGTRHAGLERSLIEYVVGHGWLDGKLKPKEQPAKPVPTADEIKAKKIAHLEAKMKRWTTKARRADTAMRKLKRSLNRLKS